MGISVPNFGAYSTIGYPYLPFTGGDQFLDVAMGFTTAAGDMAIAMMACSAVDNNFPTGAGVGFNSAAGGSGVGGEETDSGGHRGITSVYSPVAGGIHNHAYHAFSGAPWWANLYINVRGSDGATYGYNSGSGGSGTSFSAGNLVGTVPANAMSICHWCVFQADQASSNPVVSNTWSGKGAPGVSAVHSLGGPFGAPSSVYSLFTGFTTNRVDTGTVSGPTITYTNTFDTYTWEVFYVKWDGVTDDPAGGGGSGGDGSGGGSGLGAISSLLMSI